MTWHNPDGDQEKFLEFRDSTINTKYLTGNVVGLKSRSCKICAISKKWLTDWLTGWLTIWLTEWLNYWRTATVLTVWTCLNMPMLVLFWLLIELIYFHLAFSWEFGYKVSIHNINSLYTTFVVEENYLKYNKNTQNWNWLWTC